MKLGQGTFGSVYVDSKEKTRAIKQFDSLSSLVREVTITRYVQSEYSVKLLGVSPSQKTMITTRWSTSLDNVIKKETLTREQKKSIHKCILEGLAYLNNIYVVHADLKPGNILVDEKRKKAVLTDYGLSSINNSARVDCTAPGFSPKTAKAHCTHDLFSFVIVTLELMYDYKLRSQIATRAKLREIVKSKVSDETMCKVLCAMIGDDLKKCMRASQALKELYGITIPVPEFFAVRDIYRSVDEDTKWLLTHRIKNMSKQFYIDKCARCCDVMISLASILTVHQEKLLLYASVLCYIFSCVFRKTKEVDPKNRLRIEHIKELDNCSLREIYDCITTILSDRDIVAHIYAP